MEFFMITTNHLTEKILFRDRADFVAGMNFIAIVSFLTGVNVLSFVLMSNHIHIVIEGSRGDALKLINLFKKYYSAYYQRKYGGKDFLRRLKVDIRALRLEDESVQRAIAYVEMNPVAANICASSSMYQWGTGRTFFNISPEKGRRLDSYSAYAKHRLLKSRAQLPGDYIVGEDGYILPRSFVKVQFVESVFRTPKTYIYFLNNSSKARTRLEKAPTPSFRDQIILSAGQDLLHSLFRATSMQDLSNQQKAELIRQLRLRLSADISQICRVFGFSPEEAANLLDNY